MSSEVEEDIKPKGSPSWMTTFADMMSLLMCFFVLLLSFAELDVIKFKQIAGSMKLAFGVQNQIPVNDIPKGTSVIMDEFSPSTPEPTPINTVTQHTMEATQPVLKQDSHRHDADREAHAKKQKTVDQEKQNQALLEQLNQLLKQEIDADLLELELLGQQVIIRLKEQGAFASGSGFLQPRFKPLLGAIATHLAQVPGQITVSGHTDDLAVSNELYTSNWDLSAKRASQVVDALLANDQLDSGRVAMHALADTRPLIENNSAENRAKNRRVEIAVMQGQATEAEPVSLFEELNIEEK